MSVTIYDPVTEYNTDNATSYISLGYFLTRNVGTEIWVPLDYFTAYTVPMFLRVDATTGLYIDVVDVMTVIGSFPIYGINNIQVDNYNSLVLFSGTFDPSGGLKAFLVAWNFDGTLAWEQTWTYNATAVATSIVQQFILNPLVGTIYCVTPKTAERWVESIDVSTGARTTLFHWTDPWYEKIALDNSDVLWCCKTVSGTNRFGTITTGGTFTSLHTLTSGSYPNELVVDYTNNIVYWVIQNWPDYNVHYWNGSSVVTISDVHKNIGDLIAGTLQYNTTTNNFIGTLYYSSIPLIINSSTFDIEKRIDEPVNSILNIDYNWSGRPRYVHYTNNDRIWLTWEDSNDFLRKLILWEDDCATSGNEPVLYVGSISYPRVNSFSVTNNFDYLRRVDKDDGNFMADSIYPDFYCALKFGNYGYYFGEFEYAGDGPYIYRVNLLTGEYVDSLLITNPVGSGQMYLHAAQISEKNNFIWLLGLHSTNLGIVIYKIDLDTFTIISSDITHTATYAGYVSSGTENILFSLDNWSIYIGVERFTLSAPDKYIPCILTLDPSDLSELDLTLMTNGAQTAGYSKFYSQGIIASDSYLYIGAHDITANKPVLIQYWYGGGDYTAGFTTWDVSGGGSTPTGDSVMSVFTDGSYIFAVNQADGTSATTYLSRMFIYDLTLDDTITISTEGETNIRPGITFNNQIILVPGDLHAAGESAGTFNIWNIDIHDLTVTEFTVTLPDTSDVGYTSFNPFIFCGPGGTILIESIQLWINV